MTPDRRPENVLAAAGDGALAPPWEGARWQSPPVARRRLRDLVLGGSDTPAWARPSLFGLLAVTALLYLWSLGSSGWANAFYSAAVQAGTQSWKAFFFGSLDASSFITVDKSPAALWVMELSARLFGLSSWSILAPQALEGVATVAILYAAVRRWFGPAAGLIAGAVLALTPVAALMFRFNNPDALLVLLLTGAAYATLRAVEDGRTRWLVLASALIGTAFLAKMLQAFIVVPVVALVYLTAGRPSLGRRLVQLVVAAVTLVVASGWWVAIVEAIPASVRPYIGGSQDNSVISLVLGYNGLGRLTGDEAGSVGGFGAIGSRWGVTGWNRLFLDEMGGQVSWLIPAALVLLVAGLVVLWRRPRTDTARASFALWGGWLLLTGAVFSFAQGIIHPYYTVALAPAIGALAGMGAAVLWARRSLPPARLVLAGAVAVTCVWSFVLLGRTPDWLPLLRVAVLALGLPAAVAIAVLPMAWRPALIAASVAGLVVSLAGPAAYTLATVAVPHTGAIPSAGPAVAFSMGGPGGGGPMGGRRPARFGGNGGPGAFGPPPGTNGGQAAPRFGGTQAGGGAPTGGAGGPGGILSASQPGSQLVSLLKSAAGRYDWVAATISANSAAGYQLATNEPVMAIGGFNGSDPAPSLATFQEYVAQGRIHYFIAGGGPGGGPGGGSASVGSQIGSWVQAHYTATTVNGVTVYDLTAPTTS